jgi:hypothetical protein
MGRGTEMSSKWEKLGSTEAIADTGTSRREGLREALEACNLEIRQLAAATSNLIGKVPADKQVDLQTSLGQLNNLLETLANPERAVNFEDTLKVLKTAEGHIQQDEAPARGPSAG